jgi:hypothetical protein
MTSKDDQSRDAYAEEYYQCGITTSLLGTTYKARVMTLMTPTAFDMCREIFVLKMTTVRTLGHSHFHAEKMGRKHTQSDQSHHGYSQALLFPSRRCVPTHLIKVFGKNCVHGISTTLEISLRKSIPMALLLEKLSKTDCTANAVGRKNLGRG